MPSSFLNCATSDLTFVLVSTPSLPLFPYGHKFLIIAPLIEGLLGGLATLQSAMYSYLSDCTSAGSRSQIFSRFTGIFYIGFFVGPSFAGYLVEHPLKLFGHNLPIGSAGIDLSPFWVAILCSFANFAMALFVFPESLKKEKRERARRKHTKVGGDSKGDFRMRPPVHDIEVLSGIGNVSGPVIYHARRVGEDSRGLQVAKGDILTQFFRPLAIFLPTVVATHGTTRQRRDWNLTLLAIGLFTYTLSTVRTCFLLPLAEF